MNKIIYILMMFIFAVNINVLADTYDCVPDCPQDPFIYDFPPVVVTFGTCTMTIYWGHRLACGVYHDIIINGIDFSGNCSFLDENDMLSFAALQVMKSSYVRDSAPIGLGWPVPQGPNDCVTNWRVNKWACWRQVDLTPPTSNPHRLIGCNNDPAAPCCLTWYKICIDNLGREIITIEDEDAPPTACETAPEWFYPCMKVCD